MLLNIYLYDICYFVITSLVDPLKDAIVANNSLRKTHLGEVETGGGIFDLVPSCAVFKTQQILIEARLGYHFFGRVLWAQAELEITSMINRQFDRHWYYLMSTHKISV